VLVAAAYCVTRWTGDGRGRAGCGWPGRSRGSRVHVHALNLVFVPCSRGYALAGGGGGGAGWSGPGWRCDARGGLLLLGQWLRFGDPLETGRFGYYSEFVAPWEGLAAQVVAPGRSFLLYSPAVLLGLFGWAALRRRAPEVCWFAGAAILLRWAAISTRSDWFGGWGLGARHLVPVIPLAMLALRGDGSRTCCRAGAAGRARRGGQGSWRRGRAVGVPRAPLDLRVDVAAAGGPAGRARGLHGGVALEGSRRARWSGSLRSSWTCWRSGRCCWRGSGIRGCWCASRWWRWWGRWRGGSCCRRCAGRGR
jgi:hypothetical protein